MRTRKGIWMKSYWYKFPVARYWRDDCLVLHSEMTAAGTRTELRYSRRCWVLTERAPSSLAWRWGEVRWGSGLMTSSHSQLTPTVRQQPGAPPTQSAAGTEQRVVGAGISQGSWTYTNTIQWEDKYWKVTYYSIHSYLLLLFAHLINLFLDTDWIPGTGGKFLLLIPFEQILWS